MSRNILVINGHPDPREGRLCAALVSAYVRGASAEGHRIRRIDVGALAFPTVRTAEEFAGADLPADIREAQEAFRWAEHVVIVHPLWLGGVPAFLKAFLEQVFRYGFAVSAPGEPPRGLLKGRSVRVVVTMGMPAPVFRWVFGAYGLKSLERGVLWLAGFRPIRHLVLGGAEGDPRRRERWLRKMERLGAQAL